MAQYISEDSHFHDNDIIRYRLAVKNMENILKPRKFWSLFIAKYQYFFYESICPICPISILKDIKLLT